MDPIARSELPARFQARPTKLRYVQYTDESFSVRAISPAHLGILGPVLRAVAGEFIAVTFLNRTDRPLSIHPHGTYGVIGAAVAAARLKRFDAQRMLELLNVSATMGMATSRQTLLDGATVRNIFTGHSGYMGLTAVRLVECGFTGEIDGVANVYGKVLSDTFDPARVVAGLGTDWLIAENYFKLHPTGRYVHSAIDALEDLLARAPGGGVAPRDIERIEVRTYMLAAMLGEKRIVSSFGALFSVPFALASILVHGRSGLASFDEVNADDASIQQPVEICHALALPFRFWLCKTLLRAEKIGDRF
jgi:2-methylcitrate dehydratase PrpD